MQSWSEMAQQMATTIFNADGGRLEHQEELAKRGGVTTGARLSVEKRVEGRWW